MGGDFLFINLVTVLQDSFVTFAADNQIQNRVWTVREYLSPVVLKGSVQLL